MTAKQTQVYYHLLSNLFILVIILMANVTKETKYLLVLLISGFPCYINEPDNEVLS